jgi:hypothetical protein
MAGCEDSTHLWRFFFYINIVQELHALTTSTVLDFGCNSSLLFFKSSA